MIMVQAGKPARMSLSNLSVDPIRTVEAMFNPTEWSTSIQNEFVQHQVPGLSYRPKQYTGTANSVIPLELFHFSSEPGDKTSLQEYSRWYESLAFPLENGLLPVVLFRWPRIAAVPCNINKVETKFQLFARDGAPRQLTVMLELETYNNGTPPTYESVGAFGWVRSGTPAGRTQFLDGVPR
jgi:hypothetical protein